MHTKAAMLSRRPMLGLLALATSWLASCVLPNEAFVDPLDTASGGGGPEARSEEDSSSEESKGEDSSSSGPACQPTLCFHQNDEASVDTSLTAQDREWAVRVEIPSRFSLVQRVELMTGGTTAQSTLGLHTSDSEQNPGETLASRDFAIQATTDWQGVQFIPPLRLVATQMPWVIWKLDDPQGVQASQASSGTPMSVFGRSAAEQAWTPKVQNAMLRIYCCEP